MSDGLTNVVGIFAIVVIVISLASFGVSLTGHAVETGTVNVTVESSANINISTDLINFGSGLVNSTYHASATLESNKTSASPNGNWSWSVSNFTIENIGNVNVTLQLRTNQNSTEYIGGTADGGPLYQYAVYEVEANSCNVTTGNALKDWYDVNNTSPGTLFCNPFDALDSRDTIQVNIKLKIPSDSNTGELLDTFTATATAL